MIFRFKLNPPPFGEAQPQKEMELDIEQIEKLADEYADQYVERFQKIARQAFLDGFKKAASAILEEVI